MGRASARGPLMPIPARLHFCWIGTSLPWAYAFAVLSAAERGRVPEIVLHHTDPLEDGDTVRALRATPGVRLRHIDAVACLARADEILGLHGALEALYHRLDRPATRCDVLRAAILFLDGGIYLDLDTVTVASLRPLTRSRNVVGTEFIVWPDAARTSRSVLVLARHLSLDLLRKVLKRLPGGWRAFRHVERFYPRGINNAVMGAEQGSAVFADYLRSMTGLPPERQRLLYALGPRLLQDVAARHGPAELAVADPHVFYPLPPEISEHWFRITRRARLHQVLSGETRVVHWYASIRGRVPIARITPGYVRQHRERQLYSALVHSCIGALPEAA